MTMIWNGLNTELLTEQAAGAVQAVEKNRAFVVVFMILLGGLFLFTALKRG